MRSAETAPTIRAATPADMARMTDISMRSKQSNGYDDAFMAQCVDELTVTEERLAARDYWVAETDDICGLAALEISDGNIAEVHAFFVDPAMKRQGIGSALWEVVLSRAQALRLAVLELDADPSSVPFYERLGFTIVGERPSQSIPGRVLPRMRRRADD